MNGHKQLANLLTGSRMVCSLLMLLCPVCSAAFWVIYALCGLSDILDGWAARRYQTESTFGAALDTGADALFVAAAFWKLLPVLGLPVWQLLWIGGIGVMKLSGVLLAAIRRKNGAVHSRLNKLTGVVLFLLPLTFPLINSQYSVTLACILATLAAIQESILLLQKETT